MDVQEAAETLLAIAGDYWKSSQIYQRASQPIAVKNLPHVRRSPRLATGAAGDGPLRVDDLPLVRTSPRLAAKAANEKRLKKQSPESSKRRRSTKTLSQDRKLALFGKWDARSSIARTLLQIRWCEKRARSARRACVRIHRITSSVAENTIG